MPHKPIRVHPVHWSKKSERPRSAAKARTKPPSSAEVAEVDPAAETKAAAETKPEPPKAKRQRKAKRASSGEKAGK